MTTAAEFMTLFTSTEALTPKIYTELLKKGFTKENLDQAKALGFEYNRTRNSLVSPPEFNF